MIGYGWLVEIFLWIEIGFVVYYFGYQCFYEVGYVCFVIVVVYGIEYVIVLFGMWQVVYCYVDYVVLVIVDVDFGQLWEDFQYLFVQDFVVLGIGLWIGYCEMCVFVEEQVIVWCSVEIIYKIFGVGVYVLCWQ